MNIINLIARINDIEKLKLIYQKAEQVNQTSSEIRNYIDKLNFNEAVVEIKEGQTFQQILDEQNYKPITFESFRNLADQIKWEHSLDELLAELD